MRAKPSYGLMQPPLQPALMRSIRKGKQITMLTLVLLDGQLWESSDASSFAGVTLNCCRGHVVHREGAWGTGSAVASDIRPIPAQSLLRSVSTTSRT